MTCSGAICKFVLSMLLSICSVAIFSTIDNRKLTDRTRERTDDHIVFNPILVEGGGVPPLVDFSIILLGEA